MSCSSLRKYLTDEGITVDKLSVDLVEIMLNGESVRNEKSWDFRCPTKWYCHMYQYRSDM